MARVPPTRRRKPEPVDWDDVADVRTGELTAAEGDVLAGDHLDALLFDGVTFGDLRADEASFLDCRLRGCSFDDARLRRARFGTTVLDDVRAPALDVADSQWADVAVRGGRFGALIAHGAHLERVTVDGGRLDYVNLRAATLTQVQFLDARIGELDLGGATLGEVRFAGCEVGKLVLSGATLDAVDLRGASLDALEGVGSLDGATISEPQLGQLAEALAAHLGITVS